MSEDKKELNFEELEDVAGGYRYGGQKPSSLSEIICYLQPHPLCRDPKIQKQLRKIAHQLYAAQLTVGTPEFEEELHRVLISMGLI